MKEKTIWHMKNMNTKSFMNMMANTAKAHATATNTSTPLRAVIRTNTTMIIRTATHMKRSAAAVAGIATTIIQVMTKRIPKRKSSR